MPEICDNEIDDDGDGLIDCYDPDCASFSNCCEFYYGTCTEITDCEFFPPTINAFELEEIFQTNQVTHPIDQRCAVYVGDMDGDGIPELVSKDPNPARLQIFSGVDGSIKQSIIIGGNHPFGQTAIADVDRDGLGDIFLMENGNLLARYEYGSTTSIWKTGNNIGDNTSQSTPQVADFDGDGNPEVYVGNRIFNSLTGTRLAIGNGSKGNYNNGDKFTLAYDVYQAGDPRPNGGTFGTEANGLELIAGDQVYTYQPGNGSQDNGTLTVVANAPNSLDDGFTSIGDVDGDMLVDVIVLDSGRIYVWNPRTQQQIGSTYQIQSSGSGGRINVGDFDNDGMVEIGTAGLNTYVVLEYNAGNNTLVEKWKKTGLDDGSQRTGSSLFDFEGDGIAEVVYSEEEFLYVFRGTDGTELTKIQLQAGTRTEYPLVADVNADGAAEIIMTGQYGNGPGFSGNGFVRVYRSKNTPWVSARPVWNQHGYHITNINDNLTVPLVQQNNFHPDIYDLFNGFLTQSSKLENGSIAFASPDAVMNLDSASIYNGTANICPDLNIFMTITNSGDAELPGSVPISFYNSDPTLTAATLLGTTTIGTNLEEGQSANINYILDISPLITPIDIFAVVNDPGFVMADLPYNFMNDFPVTGTGECDFENNLHSVNNVICEEVCDNGQDNDADGLIDEPNINTTIVEGCSGDVLPAFTTDVTGTWSVTSTIGTTISTSGVVTLGTNHSPTPHEDIITFSDGLCTEMVIVRTFDAEKPAVICPSNQTIYVDGNCNATIPDYTTVATATDNCSDANNITLTQSPAANGPVSLGNTTITITATDQAGNTAMCMFTLLVRDNIKPTITCPNNQDLTLDGTCQIQLPDYSTQATVNDNCSSTGNITINQTPPAGFTLTGHNTTQLITLLAIDESGNEESCSFTITLKDTSPPSITCPSNQILAIDEMCTILLPDYTNSINKSDNCSATSNITLTQSPVPGTNLLGHGITQQVTITATDEAGNISNCSFDVTLDDQTIPMISCPENQTLSTDNNCNVAIPDYTNSASVMDNCTSPQNIVITQMPTAGTILSGLNTIQLITLTANDNNGNTQTCSFTVTLIDEIAPSITCPSNQTALLNTNCERAVPSYISSASFSDNCNTPGQITITQSPSAGTILTGENSVHTITLTATDLSNNQANCSFELTLLDQIPPSIICPMNQLLSVDGNCPIALPDYTNTAMVDDNCSPLNELAITQNPVPGTMLSGDGTMENVTLTVTDNSGNNTSCSFTVTLDDSTNPIVTCPADRLLYVDANCRAFVPDLTADVTVSSNCTNATNFGITQLPSAGFVLTGNGTTQTVTITASDGNGNANSCDIALTLTDTIAPTINCPLDITLDANADCQNFVGDYRSQAVVSDNCTNSAVISVTQSPIPGTAITGHDTEQIVTLTANDGNGNTSNCTFTITLRDVTAPIFTCPADVTIDIDANCQTIIPNYINNLIATDNCSANSSIIFTQTPAAGTSINGNNTTQVISISGIDEAGNTASCQFTITLNDAIPPSITCPANEIINLDNGCAVAIPDYTNSVIINDNCSTDANITISQSPVAGMSLSGHNTVQTITITATDEAGLSSDCSFDITLNDDIAPTLNCPSDLTINLDTNCEAIIPDLIASATFSDNCTINPNLTITQTPAAGATVSGAGVFEQVTITVDDNNGNATSCTVNIYLNDNILPLITCPADVTLQLDNECEAILQDYRTALTLSDNCTSNNDLLISQVPVPGTILENHNTIQEMTILVDDGNGNIATCSFDVSLEDLIAPSITCPTNQSVEVDDNCEITLADYTSNATVNDNCIADTGIILTQSPAVGTTIPGANTIQVVTLTADDGNGNTSNCTFEVPLIDNIAPTISCPANQTLNVDNACNIAIPDYTSLVTVMDNCSTGTGITMSQSPIAGTIVNGHNTTQTITITATDTDGNASSCAFNVTLQDITAPTISCPTNQVIFADANCEVIIPDYSNMAPVADNCTPELSLSISQSPIPGTIIMNDGTVQTIDLTVDDGNGNTTSCSFDVSVEDNTAPSLICPGNQDISVDDVCQVPLPDYRSSTMIIDNCAAMQNIIITQTPAPNTMVSGPGSTILVTITANDGNGNIANCTFDVNLIDSTDPAITCPATQELFVDAACEVALPDYTTALQVTNNCMMGTGITVTQSPSAGTTLAGAGTSLTVTLTADDGNNNMTNCTFEVMLTDTISPSISCPINKTDIIDDNCQFEIPDYTSEAIVNDNCALSNEIIVTQNPVPGTTLPGPDAMATITLTANDGNGNTSSCSFELSISDQTVPVVNCPANQEITVDENCEVVLPDYRLQSEFGDNCTPGNELIVNQTPAPGTVLSGHNTTETINIMVADNSGNTANCTFEVNIIDQTTPNIECPGDQDLALDQDCQAVIPNYTSLATVDDNCDNNAITVTQNVPVGTVVSDAFNEIEIILTATDIAGNTNSCSFEVTLIDTTKPSIACPPDITLDLNANCEVVLQDYTGLTTYADNCTNTAGISITQSPPAGTILNQPGAVQTILMTVSDESGNDQQCTFNVTIDDISIPNVTCPSNDTIYLNEMCNAIVPDYLTTLSFSDNCTSSDEMDLTQSPAPGAIFNIDDEIVDITILVNDGNGNITTCMHQLTVLDTISPEVLYTGEFHFQGGLGCGLDLPDFTENLEVSDNCAAPSELTITQTPLPDTNVPENTTQTITIQVDDNNGNSTTIDFDIEVNYVPICPTIEIAPND